VSSGLGGFEFKFNTDIESNKIFADIYLGIFVVFQTIFMLNFVVAILSNTYENMFPKANSLYLRRIILLRHRLEHSKHSSLVSGIVPMNILTLLIFPLQLIINDKVNDILLKIMYIPIGLVGILFYSLTSLLLVPIAYFGALFYQIF
jgi:hypothetical protein